MPGKHSISTDKSLLNVALIHDYLSNYSYWGKGRTLHEVQTTIENSTCFGLYNQTEQVGFCRVVSDKVAFAYVMDFFVVESHRGKGLGKLLMTEVLANQEFKSVTWYLATNDAHGLYRKFGFQELDDPQRFMKKVRASDS